MKMITIDGMKMISKEETHEYLKSKLSLTGYLGNNLDSLWDVLSTNNQPLEIHFIHPEIMLEHLGEYGEALLHVFQDAAKENRNVYFRIDEQ